MGNPHSKKFIGEINAIHPSIKFECHQSRTRVNFLDTYVHLDASGNLSTSLFTKPTDRNAYLHHESYHPPKQLANIPYGQFLRAKKICSKPEDANLAMDAIERKFHERGFPQELTKAQRLRTNSVPREDLLVDKQKEPSGRTPFTTTYNHHHPPIQRIINSHWHLLETDRKSAASFKERPIVAFRRNRNLREILGQTHISRGKKIVKKPQHGLLRLPLFT